MSLSCSYLKDAPLPFCILHFHLALILILLPDEYIRKPNKAVLIQVLRPMTSARSPPAPCPNIPRLEQTKGKCE